MSFDHWLIRDFPKYAPDIPAGLTAYGGMHAGDRGAFLHAGARHLASSPMLSTDLPNPFVSFVRDRLEMPVITWTVRDKPAVELTFAHADQMTFEGFDPDGGC